eukprot:snap_masked-scaffold_13-processed-gene-11.21-mRNA-1 protein AED:1.00 eAED:1.00 QI:0/-1/0/0/-1/1/1/0/869
MSNASVNLDISNDFSDSEKDTDSIGSEREVPIVQKQFALMSELLTSVTASQRNLNEIGNLDNSENHLERQKTKLEHIAEKYLVDPRKQSKVAKELREELVAGSLSPKLLGSPKAARITRSRSEGGTPFEEAFIKTRLNIPVKGVAPNNEKLKEAIIGYHRRYIHNNKFKDYIQGFKNLDNILNVFFFEFLKLRRSSLQCSKLWISAMRTRFLFICAVGFLLERSRFAKPEYKAMRLMELLEYVNPLRHSIAKCTQFLATFNLHSDLPPNENEVLTNKQKMLKRKADKKRRKKGKKSKRKNKNIPANKRELKFWNWHFLRSKFLTNLGTKLAEENQKLCNKYRNFLVDVYDMGLRTSDGFTEHMKLKVEEASRALYSTDFNSQRKKYNEQIIDSLAIYIETAFGEKVSRINPTEKPLVEYTEEQLSKDGYIKLREWYWVCRDTWGLRLESKDKDPKVVSQVSMSFDNLNSSVDARSSVKDVIRKGRGVTRIDTYDEKDIVALTILDRAKQHLISQSKNSPKVGAGDNMLYEYQQGLKSLGPFELIPLKEPENFFDIRYDEDKEKVFYRLKKEIAESLPGLSWAKGLEGVGSPLSKISIHRGSIPDGSTKQEVLKASKIHPEASSYRFLYPLDHATLKLEETDFELCQEFVKHYSPIHLILMNGAFAYYKEGHSCEKDDDKKDSPVEINGITLGDDLFFDGPYKVNPKEVDIKHEDAVTALLEELEDKKLELTNVTLPHLKDVGCEKFIFVPNDIVSENTLYRRVLMSEANEEIIRSSFETWEFKGAFAYLYHQKAKKDLTEEERKKNHPIRISDPNYFSVTSFKSITAKVKENNNTPIIEKLDRILRTFNPLWEQERNLSRNEYKLELKK